LLPCGWWQNSLYLAQINWLIRGSTLRNLVSKFQSAPSKKPSTLRSSLEFFCLFVELNCEQFASSTKMKSAAQEERSPYRMGRGLSSSPTTSIRRSLILVECFRGTACSGSGNRRVIILFYFFKKILFIDRLLKKLILYLYLVIVRQPSRCSRCI
jgi:hypothetical protein